MSLVVPNPCCPGARPRDSLDEHAMTPPLMSLGKGSPIDALLRRARAGDLDALAELFSYSRPLLDRWASLRLATARLGIDRPSDIAQETALRALDKFSTFNGTTEAEWHAWLKAVLHSRADQAFRDAARMKRDALATRPLDSAVTGSVAADQATVSQVMAREQHWRQTLANIYQLPPDQRDAIWLCHLKELPVTEVAERLGKTEAAVAGLLRRGLQTLRARAAGTASHESARGPERAADSIAAALLGFLHQRDSGASAELEAFLAGHPEHTDELRLMLEWIAHIQGIRKTPAR
jgi:RNA polymerase sigma-70 factor (ECF subfamily)